MLNNSVPPPWQLSLILAFNSFLLVCYLNLLLFLVSSSHSTTLSSFATYMLNYKFIIFGPHFYWALKPCILHDSGSLWIIWRPLRDSLKLWWAPQFKIYFIILGRLYSVHSYALVSILWHFLESASCGYHNKLDAEADVKIHLGFLKLLRRFAKI